MDESTLVVIFVIVFMALGICVYMTKDSSAVTGQSQQHD
jgi:hypothetical protein